jgi:hypothetical protein
MKGDFTRDTFDRKKHYNRVRMQQGRVQMDADWNEQADIEAHRDQVTTRDVIGPCGGPLHEAGFSIQPTPDGTDLEIGAGRYYVDGILSENEEGVLFTAQPDLPGEELPSDGGTYLAYLDVWQRHLTALDDETIREVALGGPDTATRIKTLWQVKLIQVDEGMHCLSALPKDLIPLSTGRLAARAEPDPTSENPCDVDPNAGYRGLENQLYRVEIHAPGPLGTATFKWSRDNGSIVTKWASQDAQDLNKLTVGSIGRDVVFNFSSGQWIALTDDTRELKGERGVLVKITEVNGLVLTLDASTIQDPDDPAADSVDLGDFPLNPKVRRWEMESGEITTGNAFIPLENGVEVKFEPGDSGDHYKTGDYWLIPARTVTGDIEWPKDGSGAPLAVSPHGIEHHYCHLALLQSNGLAWSLVSDCRDFFPPVTELTSLFYVSGDGQEVMPDLGEKGTLVPLPHPLQVGVANGSHPVAGATIHFEVVGGGTVTPTETTTNADGIASCVWSLLKSTSEKEQEDQKVTARLLDAAGEPAHIPIIFTANLSIASEVAYDPSNCPELQEAGAYTVQAAIDALCAAREREPGILVKGVEMGGVSFQNDTNVSVATFAGGLRVQCDNEIDPNSIRRPTCFITLEVPFPVTAGKVESSLIGFSPLVLASEVNAIRDVISWTPLPGTVSWLTTSLFQTSSANEDKVLARLTLKGNFIWGAKDGTLYLDGDAFGVPGGSKVVNTDISFPSGDGKKGGDFEMWFWLVPPTLDIRTLTFTTVSATAAAWIIMGTVVNDASDPVLEATITLTDPSGKAINGTTNTDGVFQLTVNVAGTYRVIATKEGYLPSKEQTITISNIIVLPPIDIGSIDASSIVLQPRSVAKPKRKRGASAKKRP